MKAIPVTLPLLSKRIDSILLEVCHPKRIQRNQVFRGLAKRGKTSLKWFFGFKLHLVINEKGEILAFQVTPRNVSDVSVIEILSKGIFGKLFGDKGYSVLQISIV